MNSMQQLGQRAKKASFEISSLTTQQKNDVLKEISNILIEDTDEILKQNEIDIQNAKSNGISDVMVDRLLLTEERIKSISKAIDKVIQLEDPVGVVLGGGKQPNGLNITKVSVPLGVIGIIFESRPNVTVDAAVLCIKSGNVTILRGGKEAINTNKALVKSMRKALKNKSLPEDMVLLVEDTSRDSAVEMMKLNGFIDVLIPRGGAGLIKTVVENSTVPVIETGTGNCHIYVDESATLDMAVNVVNNAKTSRPSVCNACESLLVHKNIANEFLRKISEKFKEHDVQILGCEETKEILKDITLATQDDYMTEFLDYKISVKVVNDIDEAIAHINKYTTKHSECIITNDLNSSIKFTTLVDAAAVYVNASTRFTDGGEFGLGAEIGISTQKLHARGPMGLQQLTTSKYIIQGNGQIRV